MNTEGWQTPSQLHIFVFGVDLGGSHQVAVFAEDFLLHISNFHEAERQELFQAGKGKRFNQKIKKLLSKLFIYKLVVAIYVVFFQGPTEVYS